jgi:hypothetical protein
MNKTKYLIALSVALFWACSDSPNEAGTTEIDNTMAQNDSSSSIAPDTGNSSSSVGGKQPSSSEPQSSSSIKEKPSKAFAADTKNGFKLGSCITTLARRTFLAADIAASEELPEAYLLNDGEGHYQVMLLNVNDYCAVVGSAKTTRSGDTLEIAYGPLTDENGDDIIGESACMCNSDHWFDIEAKNNDIEFVRFSGKTYEVSNKPDPEPSKSNTERFLLDANRYHINAERYHIDANRFHFGTGQFLIYGHTRRQEVQDCKTRRTHLDGREPQLRNKRQPSE